MLSLYINAARVGSTRLTMLFREYGFYSYNEPFHTINEKNEERKKRSWGGDRETIIEYSNLKLEDITFEKDTKIKRKIYSKVLRAYSKAPKYYIIGLQPNCFKSIKSKDKSNQYLTDICSIYPCIFIQRKNIDIYISSLKAKLTKTFAITDTTDIKPRAEASDFKRLVEINSDFYNRCYQSVISSHQNATIINYEDWAFESNDEQLDKIKLILSSNKAKFFKLPTKEYVDFHDSSKNLNKKNVKKLIRQDKNLLWEEKISNYSEFIGECKKLGIEEWINNRQINF